MRRRGLDYTEWIPVQDLKGMCSTCKHKIEEFRMAECGKERREFPSARQCNYYLPELQDE